MSAPYPAVRHHGSSIPLLEQRGADQRPRGPLLKPRLSQSLSVDGIDEGPFEDQAEWDDVPLSRSSLRRGVLGGSAFGRRKARNRTIGLATFATAMGAMALVGACVPFGGMLSREGPTLATPSRDSSKLAARAPADPALIQVASRSSEQPEPRQDGPANTGSVMSAALASITEIPRAMSLATEDPARAKQQTARLDTASLSASTGRSLQRNQPSSRAAMTKFVGFESGPFPFDGAEPGTGQPFLNAEEGEERGHRSGRGRLLRESETFSDNRAVLHIPKGFDPDRPGVIVVFFHGHGAMLKRDIAQRQKVPQQVSASGANALLVAPQFAVDASDSSAGKFWEQGGFARFMNEAAQRLAQQYGDAAAAEKIAAMPIIVVSYSGGFVPAAYSLSVGGVANRVRGLVLLDSIYGEQEKFADWMANSRNAFLINCSTPYTSRQASELERQLSARDVATGTELKANLSRGGATFLSSNASHRDYVTQAWTENPIADVLRRLPEYRLRGGEPMVASRGDRSTVAAAQ